MAEKDRVCRAADLLAAQEMGEKRTVEGYAVVFDAPAVLFEMGGTQYKEIISRGALDGANMADVPFKYNHDGAGMPMARTRNGTLRLTVDEKGLKVSADLADTTAGRDLYELIRRGDIDKMSFAFKVSKDSYERSSHTRRIEKIKRVYDVSAVDLPAYEATSIAARGFFELEREKEQALERAAARKRRLLIIRTKI
jgi:HK97 family phage prohead protease